MSLKIARSPRYPQIGLKEAIDKVALVYRADRRNKIPKSLVAEHMGYTGLHGASLSVISAVSKYGLLDGGRDSMWVTLRAVDIIERERDDLERIAALQAAAQEPDLFREIRENFPEQASDSAVRSYLITKRDFLPESAMRLIRAYRETQEFVDFESRVSGIQPSETLPPVELERPREIATGFLGQGPLATMTIEKAAQAMAAHANLGEREWIRGALSRETNFRLLVSGSLGPREIGKLIKLLEAQRAVLDDENDGW